MRRAGLLLVVALVLVTDRAQAQAAQLLLGAGVTHGTYDIYRDGWTLSANILVGRVVYFGVRYARYLGGTRSASDGTPVDEEIRTITAEGGIQIPAGPLEVILFAGLGLANGRRLPAGDDDPSNRQKSTTWTFAPGVAATYPVYRFLLSLETQYSLVGPMSYDPSAETNSLLVTLRFIIPFNINFYPVVFE